MQTLWPPRASVPTCRGRHSQPVYARPRNVRSHAVVDIEASTLYSPIRVSVTKALKEWAPTIEAIGHGEQMVLFRKGGIKEPTFRPEALAFLLFPTSFHTDHQLLKPGVAERYAAAMSLEPKKETVLQLPYVAEVTGAWTTYDPTVLPALAEHHAWTEQFIETRLKWRAKQPITVLELRCWRLRQPLALRVADSMFGCFSWVDLSDQVTADLTIGATPVVDPTVFAARQQRLRTALGVIQTEPLSLE